MFKPRKDIFGPILSGQVEKSMPKSSGNLRCMGLSKDLEDVIREALGLSYHSCRIRKLGSPNFPFSIPEPVGFGHAASGLGFWV